MTEFKQKVGLIIIFLFHFGLYNLCSQTTYTFDPDTNINWSNHEKWSPSYPGETIANGDTVIIKNGVSCYLDISIENFGTIILNGDLYMNSVNSKLTNNGTIENFGEFQIAGGGKLINNSKLINHHIILAATGITNPIINNTNASITNNHIFFINNYLTLTNNGIINNSETGTLYINNVFSNNNILNNDGIIKGVGNINPNISFNNSSISKIEPGINIGTLSTFGNLNMGETTLIIEIDAVANENDVFAINGNAVIENTNLIIEWINNPVANEIYSIMTFTSRNGVFSSVTIPPVPGFTFTTNYTDTEVTISVTENSLGVSDLNLNENITFWPNPIKEILNIDMGKNHEVVSVKIESILGKKVYSKKFINQSEISVNLDFESGVYIVNIITNNGEKRIFKIIKE